MTISCGTWLTPILDGKHPCGESPLHSLCCRRYLVITWWTTVENSGTSKQKPFLRNLHRGDAHQQFGLLEWWKRKVNPNWSFLPLLFATNSEGFAISPLRHLSAHLPFQGLLQGVVLKVNTGYPVGHEEQPITPEYPIAGEVTHWKQGCFRPQPRDQKLLPQHMHHSVVCEGWKTGPGLKWSNQGPDVQRASDRQMRRRDEIKQGWHNLGTILGRKEKKKSVTVSSFNDPKIISEKITTQCIFQIKTLVFYTLISKSRNPALSLENYTTESFWYCWKRRINKIDRALGRRKEQVKKGALQECGAARAGGDGSSWAGASWEEWAGERTWNWG